MYIAQRIWASSIDARTSLYARNVVGDVFVGLARLAFRCIRQKVPFQVLKLDWRLRLKFNSWEDFLIASLEEGRAQSLLDTHDAWQFLAEQPLSREERDVTYQKRLLNHLKALPVESRDRSEDGEIRDLESDLRSSKDGSLHLQRFGTRSRSLTVPELHSTIDQDTLIVQISSSHFDSVMTAVTLNGVESIVLLEGPTFPIASLFRSAMRSVNTYSSEYAELCKHGPSHDSNERLRKAKEKLDGQLSKISRIIIEPLKALIMRKKHIVFGGAHYLAGFPLAALKVDGTPLFHLAAVSQTPSLSIHHLLCKRASKINVQMTAVTKPGSRRDHLMLKEKPLPFAGIEAMLTTNMFGAWPVMAKKTTNDEFVRLMEESTIMHVGTHGQLRQESPYLAKISLKEAFRVLELSRCHSSAALVVFAACFSGIGDNLGGNDVQGFTQAVLGTGTMAFLGALWEVDDVGTMILMVLFYRAIRGQLDHSLVPESMQINPSKDRSLARLWRAAVLVFYYLDAAAAKALVKEFITELEKCERQENRDPNKIVKNWKTYLEELLIEPTHSDDGRQQMSVLDLIDFKHPFFYASFIPVGYGDLQINLPDASTVPKGLDGLHI